MGPPLRDDLPSRITALEVQHSQQLRQHEDNQRKFDEINDKLDILMQQSWMQRGAYLMAVGMGSVIGAVGHFLFEKFK